MREVSPKMFIFNVHGHPAKCNFVFMEPNYSVFILNYLVVRVPPANFSATAISLRGISSIALVLFTSTLMVMLRI